MADLLDRAFGGSAQQLVQQALASRPASSGELAEIRRLLDAMEDTVDHKLDNTLDDASTSTDPAGDA